MFFSAIINEIKIKMEEGTSPPPQINGSTPLYFGRSQNESPDPNVNPATPATAMIRPNMKKTLK